jgi:ATP-dependent DNA ligase
LERLTKRSDVSVFEFGHTPMLARPVNSLPRTNDLAGGCVYEPKFDGYRAILHVADGQCRIQSRHGQDITSAFPDIVAAAQIELPDGVVVDGELVVWGENAYDFIQVQKRITGPPRVLALNPASFIAFDLLMWDDADLRESPLSTRRQLLEMVFVDHQMPFQIAPQTTDRAEAADWMHEYSRNDIGIEGLVVKGRDSNYTSGERGWLKVRFQDTSEAVVCAVVGSLDRPVQLVIGVPTADGFEVVGLTSSITDRQQRAVRELVTPRPGPLHPALAASSVTATDLRAVEPEVVVEVSARPGHTSGGATVFDLVRVRPDLGPDEVGSVV